MDFALIWAAAFIMPLCAGQDDVVLPFTVEIQGNTGTKEIKEGSNGVYRCQATANDAGEHPDLKWFMDDVEVTERDATKVPFIETMGTALVLWIKGATEEHNSLLKCTGSLNGQEASTTMQLEVTPVLKVLSEPNQFGILGKDGVLECSTTGTPDKTWKFQDNTEITTSEKYVIDKNTLTIKSLTMEDAGTYICSIYDFADQQGDRLQVIYEVVDPPKIEMPPTIQPNNPKVGEEVKITCSAQGTPQPTYNFKRGDNVIEGNDQEVVDQLNGILTLKSITRDSEGKYTCVATNRGGTMESETTLDVRIPPVIQDIGTIEAAVENEARDITCTAEGDPAPTVTWQKVGDVAAIAAIPTGEGPEVLDIPSQEPDDAEIKRVGKILRFSSIRPADAGEYICKAISNAGTANKTIDFEVKYAPHFDTDYKETEFWGWRGHRANLTCMASANDLANFKWYEADPEAPTDVAKATRIANTPPYTIETVQKFPEYHLSSSSLLITLSDEDDTYYRSYICEADNGQTAERVVTLKKATAPGKPTLRVLKTFSTMVTMEVVKPTENGGQPVTVFKYSYYAENDATNKQTGSIKEQDIQGDATTFNIKQLQPSTDYVIEISAGNIVQDSPVQTVSFMTNKVSKPEQLTLTSPQQGLEPSSYTVSWQHPQDGGSPITKFTITFQRVSVNEQLEAVEWKVMEALDATPTTRTLNDKDALQYKITGLQSNSFYDVRVEAHNDIGVSLPAVTVIKTSAGAEDAEKQGGNEGGAPKEAEKEAASTNPASNVRDSSPGQLACNLATLLLLLATACLATLLRC